MAEPPQLLSQDNLSETVTVVVFETKEAKAYTDAETDYDLPEAELTTSRKSRGVGDCGEHETYVWDGSELQLTEVFSMLKCIGMHPSLWHLTYRAAVE